MIKKGGMLTRQREEPRIAMRGLVMLKPLCGVSMPPKAIVYRAVENVRI